MTTEARRRLDLQRTDAALAELERVHLEVTEAVRPSGTLRLLQPYPPPSAKVRALVLELQGRYEPRRKLRVGCVRNTLRAHDELMRLQGYLVFGGFDEFVRRRAS